MRLIISQEQSQLSGLLLYLINHKWVHCWFMRIYLGQIPQFAGEILFCPDISAGHFQKLFQPL